MWYNNTQINITETCSQNIVVVIDSEEEGPSIEATENLLQYGLGYIVRNSNVTKIP